MSDIYIISDTHFYHDKDFIWQKRGFNSVSEMNEALISNWNSVVQYNDIVYHLGDFCVGTTNINDIEHIMNALRGKIRLVVGNHDTETRLNIYKDFPIFEDVQYGYSLKINKKIHFLLTHYPTLTGNPGDYHKLYSIHGHTHSPNKFCEYDLMYNTSCEAINCTPISIEQIVYEIGQKRII